MKETKNIENAREWIGELCAICYEVKEEEDGLKLFVCKKCLNSVHGGCWNMWNKKSSTCPYCRFDCEGEKKKVKISSDSPYINILEEMVPLETITIENSNSKRCAACDEIILDLDKSDHCYFCDLEYCEECIEDEDHCIQCSNCYSSCCFSCIQLATDRSTLTKCPICQFSY